MKTPAPLLFAAAMLLSGETMAQQPPAECADTGLLGNYAVFTSIVEISTFEHVCGQIAPETQPSFERVLARYREESPSCYTATLQMPELKELASAPELAALVADVRGGSMPSDRREALLHACRTIEASDGKARSAREAFKTLMQDAPGSQGGS